MLATPIAALGGLWLTLALAPSGAQEPKPVVIERPVVTTERQAVPPPGSQPRAVDIPGVEPAPAQEPVQELGEPAPPITILDPARPIPALEETAALLQLADEDLLARIQADPHLLGPLSIGETAGGRLFNAVEMPADARWDIGANAQTWTTTETIASVVAGVEAVHQVFPESHPLRVGDFSDEDGGRLKRHKSHQSGRDVDVGFYFKTGATGSFVVGTAKNLDLPRNWVLVRAWLTRTDVDVILLDRRISTLLYDYALGIGEDKAWLDRVFRSSTRSMVQHVRGHRNHYHVRFFNPIAQELGRRAYPLLVQANLMPPPVFTVRHVVRKGETIGHLATRYGTTTRAIAQANGLRGNLLRAGRAYRIPVRAAATASSSPIAIPPRALPPTTPPAVDVIDWPTSAFGGGPSGGR